MKKFFWAMMLVATTLSFVACEEDKPIDDKPNPDQTEVCKDCGKNPCECDKNTEEVCPDCGKNPCECDQAPATPEWCDFYYKVDLKCTTSAVYAFDSFQMNEILDVVGGKTIHENLGFASWEELAEAIGTIEEADALDRNVLYFGYDIGSESDILEPHNTNYFGYWVGANGAKDDWGTETVRIFTEAEGVSHEEDGPAYHSGKVNVGVTHLSEYLNVGDVYTCGLVIQKTDGGTVTRAGVQVTVTVEEYQDPLKGEFPENATPGTFDVNVEGEISLSALTFGYEAVEWNEPIKAVYEKLGMTPYEMTQMGAPVVGDDGELYTGLQISALEYWLDANNEVVAWSGDGTTGNIICLKWYYGPDYYGSSACVLPGEGEVYYTDAVAACVGKTFTSTFTISYIPDENEDMLPDQEATVVNINMAVKIVD